MPTYETRPRFEKDYAALSPEQRAAFNAAVRKFVADINARRAFRKGLRVRSVQAAPGIFELTWASNGRATFEYGVSQLSDEPHVIWRRVGTHAVFAEP